MAKEYQEIQTSRILTLVWVAFNKLPYILNLKIFPIELKSNIFETLL